MGRGCPKTEQSDARDSSSPRNLVFTLLRCTRRVDMCLRDPRGRIDVIISDGMENDPLLHTFWYEGI